MKIKPNPEFLKSAPIEARRKWAKALVECPHKQGHGFMRALEDDGSESWCCLQVGHEAFGGTEKQRAHNTPRKSSPFAVAVGDVNPFIGLCERGRVHSIDCNDTHELTFPQIAHLVCPEEFPEAS